VWRYTLAIQAPGRLRQEDLEFEASLGYLVSPGLKERGWEEEGREAGIFLL
jgi:hypothetical protein